MRWHPGLPSRIRRSGMLTLCAALLASFGATGSHADTVDDQVTLQRAREMKQLQYRLNLEGMRREHEELVEKAREALEAQRKGEPIPRGDHAKEVIDDDGRLLRSTPLPRAATRAALEAVQSIPTNVAASDRSGDVLPGSGQAESSIAVWQNYQIIAWNDGDGFNGGSQAPHVQGYGYSSDGGATFTDGGAFPASGNFVWSSDPVMTVNEKTGEFYYCGLADPTAATNGIGVVRGTFSGPTLTWDPPVTAVSVSNFTNFTDKQWIVADSSNGNLYISYTDFFSSFDRIMFIRSTDGGATWSTPLQINSSPSNGYVQGSRPAVGPNGEVYVVWKELATSGTEDFIRIRKSINQGASFGGVTTAATYYDNFGSGAPGFNRERAVSFPSIAVDRTNGPNRGRVYVTFHESLNYYNDPIGYAGNTMESEANDTPAGADPFPMGAIIRGNLDANDIDWYSFTATAGTSYLFYTDSIPNPLYSMRVYCTDGVQRLSLAGDLNTPAGAAGLTVWTAPANGTYYLRMFYVSGGSAGGYRIITGVANHDSEPGRDMRDVMVAYADAGVSWTTEKLVNDEPGRYDDWLPEVEVAADGCPYVMWFDWRDDVLTCAGRSSIYVSRSADGGTTWATSQRTTDVLSDWTGTFTNIAPNQGDYSDINAGARTVNWTWADARNGDADVYTTGTRIDHAVSTCQSDTTVSPGTAFSAHFSVHNLNQLFGNDYHWTLSDDRGWTLPGGNLPLAPFASGDIEPSIAVPDTAMAGPNTICLHVVNSKGTIAATCCFTAIVNATTGVGDGALAFGLRSIVPNPAAGPARITFTLPADGRVSLEVFGLQGERVRTLASGTWVAGAHTITWNGLDEQGHTVRPGTYFVRLEGFGRSAVQRFVKMQ